MKEYEVKVVEERIVYVYADTDIDEDDMDLTICGEHGCDGCFIRYSGDIEACKREAERKMKNKTTFEMRY